MTTDIHAGNGEVREIKICDHLSKDGLGNNNQECSTQWRKFGKKKNITSCKEEKSNHSGETKHFDRVIKFSITNDRRKDIVCVQM